ncbi:hypothetical protein PVAP13_7KG096200 [Panicum virgatum]|uniref:Uncharacterized protein n=1 Tax=Panicum virgatum TaxID=38727 RepID=A0A8T0QDL0_PANVG|nr:hypothetical protein PVAP13_7KG096200 [Panicum virgatum]KAG2570663.1 hypothetical protein PVAP13_7KG096200 [Panicum virgatum]
MAPRLQLIALERGCCPKLRMSRKHSPPPASFSARRTADESAMIWVWPPAPPQRRTATPLSSFATMEFHVLRLLPSVGEVAALRRPLPSPPPQHPPTATFSSRLASCRWHQIPAAIHGETLGLRTGWGLTSLPRQSDLLLAGVTPERVTAYELPCRCA